MKILLAGGGTGGHFYPLIAVARSLKDIAEREKIVKLELIFASDEPYDANLLREEEITFLKIPAGKFRRYFSILNFIDPFKTFWGILKALFAIYLNFPDVIFAKGGYASFPALAAAKILRIPLLVHETDTVPGKVTLWASGFARRVAISFPQSVKYFPADKVALTGNPIRRDVLGGTAEEARELFGLEPDLPLILALGGSQGAQKLNDIVLDILPELVKFSQVAHQAGRGNFEAVRLRAGLILENSSLAKRYNPYGFLDEEELRSASRAASLVVARAGGGSIFEIAAWGLPSILVPLPHAAQDHQRQNAYAYAREGAAEVLEEENLTPHVLLDRIQKLLGDKARREKMSQAAKAFAKPDAAEKIALEILKLALEHS